MLLQFPPSQCAKYMKLSDPLTRHPCICVREVEEYHSHIHHYHIRHYNSIHPCVIYVHSVYVIALIFKNLSDLGKI